MIPKELKYTDQHEWVRLEGNVVTIGITHHAQDALGDITFVDLPAAGMELAKGDEACAIESTKAASSIYAPAVGKVAEVNSALEDDPGLINTDPYGNGWVYKLEVCNASEIDALMDAGQYEQFLTAQAE